MSTPDLIDRLAAHKTLGTAPREELEWLASHGSLRRLGEGEEPGRLALRMMEQEHCRHPDKVADVGDME